MQMSEFSNEKLLGHLKSLRHQERALVTDILKYLIEVEARGLHLERGFPSLYAFCMEELGYSEDEAYVRIQAMRCVKAVPQIVQKIDSGELSLSVVAKAQKVFRQKAKQNSALTIEQKTEVINRLSNASIRHAEKMLATEFPEAVLPPEKIKPLTTNLTKVEFVANQRLIDKLETLKDLLAHQNFDGRMDGLIEHLADIALKKFEETTGLCHGPRSEKDAGSPVNYDSNQNRAKSLKHYSVAQRETLKTNSHISTKTPARSRYIARRTKRQIWQKANGRCEYHDPKTGRRCSSRYAIQIDHVHDFAKGGTSHAGNLQLLCGPHNRWKSRRYLDNSLI